VADHSWLLVLHAGAEQTELVLPGSEYGLRYEPVLDTGTPDGTPADPVARAAGDRMLLAGRTLLLLRTTRDAE
jgi:glycogen operon protein